MSNHQKHPHVYDFLHQNPLGVLSTVAAGNKPWGSAVYFVVDNDLNFYFITRKKTLKYKNIDQHAVAALTVTDEDSQTTVQATGTITHVPPQEYMDIVFTKLAGIRPKDELDWAPPIEKVHQGDYMPLKLTPTRLQYANFKQQKFDVYDDYIQQII
jgi:general stress protein 26